MDQEERFDKVTKNVIWTIEAVVLGEIERLIYPSDEVRNLKESQPCPYVKFQLIAPNIEFLGACYDEYPFYCPPEIKRDVSEYRFNNALNKLFNKKYKPFAKKSSTYNLYKLFRCGMVHQMAPGKGVALTTRKESKEDETEHLKVTNGKLILVLEDLYDDFAKASIKLLEGFENGTITNKKGNEGYLELTSYS